MSQWWIDEPLFLGSTDPDAFKNSGWNANYIV